MDYIKKSDSIAPFPLWVKISFFVLALIKLWLVSGQTLAAIGYATYDDRMFLNLAANLLSGDWLGNYDKITLVKGPFYPIWIAITFILGIPLLLSQHLLYIAACILFLYAIKPILARSTILLVAIYVILLFNPMTFSFSIGDKVFRQSIYLTLTVFVIAASAGFLIRYANPLKNLVFWSIGFGLTLSAFWLTREEGIWIIPSILMIIGFVAIRIWKMQSPDLIKRLFLCVLPFGILFLSLGAVAGINKIYYGVFAIVEFKSTDFTAAYGALTRVKHAKWHPQVPVPKETRERIYKVSPAFAELKPFIEGNQGKSGKEAGMSLAPEDASYVSHDDIHGGWFVWVFRDAVEVAGYYKSAPLAMSYYRRLATEINKACDERKIDCWAERASLAPVWNNSYIRPLLKDILRTLVYTVRFDGFYAGSAPSLGLEDSLILFRDITREQLSPREYLHLIGWAFKPINTMSNIKFSVHNSVGEIFSDSKIVLNSGEDVYRHFLDKGKNFPGAKNSRFDIMTFCSMPGCYLHIESSGQLIERIPLDGSVKNLMTPQLYFYIDSLDRKKDLLPYQSKFANFKIRILSKIGRAYQIIIPILTGLVLIVYTTNTIHIFRKRTITGLWIINTAILIAIVNLLFIMAFINISSFPAIKPWYLSATYPLLLMFISLIFAIYKQSLNHEIKPGTIVSFFFFAGLLILIILRMDLFLPSKLFIEVKAPADDTFQVFYDSGKGYNEGDSLKIHFKGGDTFQTIRFRLPSLKIKKIRIDTGTRSGTTLIKSMCIESPFKKHCWTAQDIYKEFKPLHDISAFGIKDNLLSIESSGNDPYFEYIADFSGHQVSIHKRYFLIALIPIVISLLLLFYLRKSIAGFIEPKLSHLLLRLKYFSQYRTVIALMLFGILVIAKLHGSSLGVWDEYIKERVDPKGKSVFLGKPRAVRSDEWLVQTPMYLSQVESKGFFPVKNPNIRSEGQNMLVSYFAPVFDITLIGKPFNWGFFFLGKDRGLSWYWWSKLIALLLLSYEMCILLTNKNISLSVLGAFWISFSPFIQWWFSTQQVDLIIYAQAIIVAVWYYLTIVDRWKRLFWAAILTISTIGFILSFYPPFQVPLGYLILLFIAVIAYSYRSQIKLGKYDLVIFIIAFLIISTSLYSFISQSKDAVKLVMGTVYPGQRFVNGGGYDMNFLQLYLINWRLPFKAVNFSNSCELSSFLNFLPAVFIVFLKTYRLGDKLGKYLGFTLICYILFQLSWLFLRYPDWFAFYSAYSRVTENRLQEIMGLPAIYLSIWTFSLLSSHKPIKISKAIVVSLFISVLYFYSMKHTPMFDYMKSGNTFLTILFFFILNCFFLLGNKRIFGILMVLFIIVAGMTINPLSRGTGAIYNKVIAQKVLEIEHKNPGQKWAGVNSIVLGNYLVALGLKSMNSVHYYPDLNMWRLLDPEGRYAHVYNRYAHVQIQLADKTTHFELNQPDLFTVFIKPEYLIRRGVRYVVSNGKIPFENTRIKEIDRVEGDDLYIYELGWR
jgi:hypothetical protein